MTYPAWDEPLATPRKMNISRLRFLVCIPICTLLTGCYETMNGGYRYGGYSSPYAVRPAPVPSFGVAPVPSYTVAPVPNYGVNRYNPNSLANPYGAGSPYKPDGLMKPYSQYGSKYSNKSWTNPYATDAPKLYDSQGNYRGKLSANPYDLDSTSNPYGRYGSKYSIDSINNPYGAGNPYSPTPIIVVPSP